MYRPPENANRVKAIKSKFESAPDAPTTKPPLRKVKTLSEIKVSGGGYQENRSSQAGGGGSSLCRQLSDSSRRNIKRTPAFRLDRNSGGDSGIGANGSRLLQNRSRFLDNRSKGFEVTSDKLLDKNANNNVSQVNGNSKCALKESRNNKTTGGKNETEIKSKTDSWNKTYSRNKFLSAQSKFNGNKINEQKTNESDSEYTAIKLLYAKPIPKADRAKPEEDLCGDNANTPTLKISELKSILDNISFDDTLAQPEAPLYGSLRKKPENLTDSLKTALNRPLPPGPAPRKPPRTFAHTPPKPARADPKYMLEKLESALQKGTLSRKVSLPPLPAVPPVSSPDMSTSRFNLSCLNALSCTSGAAASYETVPQSNSAFFVKCRAEPVYAEPFEYQVGAGEDSRSGVEESSSEIEKGGARKSIRRSVHYAVRVAGGIRLLCVSPKVAKTKKILDRILCESIC